MHPRPLEVQVQRHLPREAHAPVDLNRRPGVAHGGLVGQQLGATDGPVHQLAGGTSGHGRLGVDDVGRVGQAGRGVHRGTGHLGPHEHVGAHVLHGLEAADGRAELLALLGVGHGEVQRLAGVAHLQRGCQERAVAPQRPVVTRYRLAGRQRIEAPQRRQRVERRRPPAWRPTR